MQLLMSALLRRGGIVHDLRAATVSDALAVLVECLPLPPENDRTALVRALERREAQGSTAIGSGIAIPHTRDTSVLRVAEPFATLCFFRNGLEFGASDGVPVRALLMIAAPTAAAHVQLLGGLGRLLRDVELRALLHRQAPPADIIARVQTLEAAHADHVQSRISGESSN